jgi:hypothetical protein
MEKDPVLKKYIILIINSKNGELNGNVKEQIKKAEIQASNTGKLGVILLAGNMLNLGVTLINCDLVLLFHNSLSADKVLQQMYRCMTERKGKKIGFVVDLNISRVLNTCINYNISNNNLNINDKLNYLIETHLINIDVDMMENKTIDGPGLVKKLLEYWNVDGLNKFQHFMKEFESDIKCFDNKAQILINKTFTKSDIKGNINAKLLVKDSEEDLQVLPTGHTRTKEQETETEKIKKEEEKQVSFITDVLTFVIPLVCYLTIKNNTMNFVKMLIDIKKNPEFLEIFNAQTMIWWGNNNLIELIQELIKNHIPENSDIFNLSVQFKMSLQSLIDQPEKTLELIEGCLKPKENEKKQFGEVFTPMELVNEMLDKLPVELWSNPTLRWFDPAVGMGNFMIGVYLRLIETLTCIEDIKERKKHILEKMLFMCELNKKNVFITKQIFDIHGEYKLNIYQGDTLLFDPVVAFGVSHFDIIVGNPPYQETKNSKSIHGKENLYTKFIRLGLKYLNKNGYLLYITPTSWLGPTDILKEMLKYDILYLNVNECKKYFNKVGSTFSFYLLQNSKNNIKTEVKTEYNNKIYISNISLNENYKMLPQLLTNDILNIQNKVFLNKEVSFIRKDIEIKKVGELSKTKNGKNKFPQIIKHNLTSYSEIKHKYQDDKKVLLFRSGYLKPIYDDFSGIGDNIMFKLVSSKKEGELLVKLYNSKLYTFLLKINKFSGFNNGQIINKLYCKIELDDITDEDLYKYFRLTEKEIKTIEENC